MCLFQGSNSGRVKKQYFHDFNMKKGSIFTEKAAQSSTAVQEFEKAVKQVEKHYCTALAVRFPHPVCKAPAGCLPFRAG
jgi:hypothetical protein